MFINNLAAITAMNASQTTLNAALISSRHGGYHRRRQGKKPIKDNDPPVTVERKYSVSEIHDLRVLAKNHIIWGWNQPFVSKYQRRDALGQRGWSSGSYDPDQVDQQAERLIRTWMMAGITADKIREEERERHIQKDKGILEHFKKMAETDPMKAAIAAKKGNYDFGTELVLPEITAEAQAQDDLEVKAMVDEMNNRWAAEAKPKRETNPEEFIIKESVPRSYYEITTPKESKEEHEITPEGMFLLAAFLVVIAAIVAAVL